MSSFWSALFLVSLLAACIAEAAVENDLPSRRPQGGSSSSPSTVDVREDGERESQDGDDDAGDGSLVSEGISLKMRHEWWLAPEERDAPEAAKAPPPEVDNSLQEVLPVMMQLFLRPDRRNVSAALATLVQLASRMGPPDPHAIPSWRPSTFLSDEEVAGHSPTNAFLETSLHVFGATQETLDFYGAGAGAPPAADETSDAHVRHDPRNPYLTPEMELERGEEIDLTALDLTGIDPALFRGIEVGPTPSRRWQWSPHGWQAVEGETEAGGGRAASCTAMFLLAVLSASGVGAPHYPQNDSRAVLELQQAADAGSTQATLALANRYLVGGGVVRSCRAALWHMKVVADDVLAGLTSDADFLPPTEPLRLRERWRNSAYMGGRQEDRPEQVELDQDQALHGVPQAVRAMGYRRLVGRGMERDPQGAFVQFAAAAAAGDEVAAFNLGYMHMNGLGVPVNYSAAEEQFKVGAERGLPSALNGLGILEFYGWGTGRGVNYTAARLHFLEGSFLGDADSMFNMGIIYESGFEVRRNVKQALYWYQRAMGGGHWKAPYVVGVMVARGEGTTPNCTRATQLLAAFVRDRGGWEGELKEAAVAYDDGDKWSALIRYVILAEEGSLVAAENAAHMLRRGEGWRDPSRTQSALHLLLRLARLSEHLGTHPGSTASAYVDAGHAYFASGNQSAACDCYSKAAALNSGEGLVNSAYCAAYGRGEGGPRNRTHASMLLHRAVGLSVGPHQVAARVALWALAAEGALLSPWMHTARKGASSRWETGLLTALAVALTLVWWRKVARSQAGPSGRGEEGGSGVEVEREGRIGMEGNDMQRRGGVLS